MSLRLAEAPSLTVWKSEPIDALGLEGLADIVKGKRAEFTVFSALYGTPKSLFC